MTGTTALSQTREFDLAGRLQGIGHALLRYGLVVILILIGLQKWTKAEAEAIEPWIAHSPFLSWMYHATSVQGASIIIGVIELLIAGMIAVRRWAPRLAVWGSAGGIVMFLTTISFLLTTPNQSPDAQGFLLKDVFLLGAAVWSTGEALAAAGRKRKEQA